MDTFYTNEKHTQILIALMKKHGIKKIIASPGATNICLVASLQNDPYFEIYSSVDERSAAYMACGLAAESGEPVVLSCTGATASRNYMPGLTEAFYRKLPILAITSTQRIDRIGHNVPQVIDRSVEPNDIFNLSVYIPEIYNDEDRWSCEVRINEAILELKHHGGGPVHINLVTNYSPIYDVKELPDVRVIKRIYYNSKMPELPNGKIGIYVGAHREWSKELTDKVDKFCSLYNAVVFCDHTSNYKGEYQVFPSLVASQDCYRAACCSVDLLLHIGDISGAYVAIFSNKTWRINIDGKICDTFKNLQYVFEMNEEDFFEKYDSKHFPEIEHKLNRPYLVLVLKVENNTYAIPFRTNVSHKACYRFKNSSRDTHSFTGLDYSKAVVVNDDRYIGTAAFIDEKEFLELNRKYYFIIKQFSAYVSGYKKYVAGELDDFSSKKYRYSTLQYFHSEIGISVKQNIEPKEKAVAASADVPAIHPAVIRRRRKVGRSR